MRDRTRLAVSGAPAVSARSMIAVMWEISISSRLSPPMIGKANLASGFHQPAFA
jgi:hypothetical protein